MSEPSPRLASLRKRARTAACDPPNGKRNKTSTSYWGVSFCRKTCRFKAVISFNKKQVRVVGCAALTLLV